VGNCCADYTTPLYPQKFALHREAAAALSVEFACGIKAMELDFVSEFSAELLDREVFCSILLEFVVLLNILRIIKVSLNKM
jgi:hypothetical protein